MINKKRLSLVGVGVLSVLALAACGGDKTPEVSWWTSEYDYGTTEISYSCPTDDNEMMETIVANFKKSDAKYANVTVKLGVNSGEGDIWDELQKDADVAPDVMLMADNNIRDAVGAETLSYVPTDIAKGLVASDGQSNVDAASINGVVYGYPYRADNTYLMFGDDTVIGEKTTIEDILAACKTAGKKFYYDFANSWYGASYLWAAGGKTYVDENSKMASDFTKDEVVNMAQYFCDLYKQYAGTFICSSDNAAIEQGFTEGTIAAAVLWNDTANLPTAKVYTLPTINGKQMKGFMGTKDIVVKDVTKMGNDYKKLSLAHAFAKFASNKESQTLRVTEKQYGPSNIEAQGSEAVKALPWFVGIAAAQAKDAFVSQAAGSTGDFWTPVETFGKVLRDGNGAWGDYGTGKAGAKAALQALVDSTGWVDLNA